MASNVVSDNFETSSGGVPQLGGTGATTCKAWVNFNGTGTVAIRDSYNVSSVSDLGTGYYQVNFTTSMPDLNFSVVASAERSGYYSQIANIHGYGNGASSEHSANFVKLYTMGQSSGTSADNDSTTATVQVFSN